MWGHQRRPVSVSKHAKGVSHTGCWSTRREVSEHIRGTSGIRDDVPLWQREHTWRWAIAVPLRALFSLRNESNNNSYNNFQLTGSQRESRWSLWKPFLNDRAATMMKKVVVTRVMILLLLLTESRVKDVSSCSRRDRRPNLSSTLEILLLDKDGMWLAE